MNAENKPLQDHNYVNFYNKQDLNSKYNQFDSSIEQNLPFPRRYAPQPQKLPNPSAYESIQIFKIDN